MYLCLCERVWNIDVTLSLPSAFLRTDLVADQSLEKSSTLKDHFELSCYSNFLQHNGPIYFLKFNKQKKKKLFN